MSKIRKWVCRKSVKRYLLLIQAVAVVLLCFCIMHIRFWTEDSDSLWEAAGNFEETSLFFRQVDTILYQKIRGQQNRELFETDGAFNGQKEIDIQSFGQKKAVKDMNTTYLLDDLLLYSSSGQRQQLHEAIRIALESGSSQSAGETLGSQAEMLESIRPITGISLMECSRWYSNSEGYVLEMYQKLDEVCQELWDLYMIYTAQQEESWLPEAPSNLRYCIRDTATGEMFTNIGAENFEEARNWVEAQEDLVFLYEGERSYNIMVANPEHVLNPAAENWFMGERFVNTNEQVLLAVDPQWPVSDSLKTFADYFVQRGMILLMSAVCGLFAFLALLSALVCTLIGTGYGENSVVVRLHFLDEIPTELMGGFYLIMVLLFGMVTSAYDLNWETLYYGDRFWSALQIAAGYLILLSAVCGMIRRYRKKTLWTNSICRMLLRSWQKVTSTRMLSGRFLIVYIVFFVLNLTFLLAFKRIGIILIIILDMTAMLYLLRDLVGKQSVYEGIRQISKGDLSYRIDTNLLLGETYEMARAINEMGDGLQEAVQSMIKNERLKAELITNVSHDLKTPLTSIVNYVDLLKRENPEGEQVRHYIDVLEQKSQRLKQLTEDLVEASRISSGNISLDIMELPFGAILEQAYGEFTDRFEEKQLKVVRNIPQQQMMIRADGSQLWRILENLMGNVYKYAKEGTDLKITLREEEGNAVLTMVNLSAQEITVEADELTGRFVRGDKSRSTEGSGLGLSIAQNLTQLMGGEFRIETSGNVFLASVRFPLIGGTAE